jgi:hypothetical protein
MKKNFNSFADLGKDLGRPKPKKNTKKVYKSSPRKKTKLDEFTNSDWIVETYKRLKQFSIHANRYSYALRAASHISVHSPLKFKQYEKEAIDNIILSLLDDIKANKLIESYKIKGLIKLTNVKQQTFYDSALKKILKNNTQKSKINLYLNKKCRKEEFLELAKQKKRLDEKLKKDKERTLVNKRNEQLAIANFISSSQIDAFNNLFLPKFFPYYSTPSFKLKLNFSQDDIKLIFDWVGYSIDGQNLEISDLYDQLSDDLYEGQINKLISARYAEKSAILFYQELGHAVSDTSIKQLDLQNDEWKLADIKAGEHYIDVKNARTSKKHGSNYSEQYVKSFKKSIAKDDVIYAGVISNYQTKGQLCSEKNGEARILGEVTNQDIKTIKEYLKKRFSNILELQLSRSQSSINNYSGLKGSFIPGWMFEYPQSFYGKNDQSENQLEEANKLLKAFEEKEISSKVDPFFYFIQCRFHDADLSKIPSEFLPIIQELSHIDQSIGLSRRSIFLFILGYTLESLSKNENFNPVIFKKIFFKSKSFPLGLLDSEQYIFNLISMLGKIWKTNRESLKQYNAFKLSGLNILRGFNNDRWETIYAYCGGSFPDMRKCKKTPIYLGQSKICNACGMLICIDCSSCSIDCSAAKNF